ncbi:hypothetical protein [Olivibacter sp. EAT-5]|uniref:Lipoprotein n=2 Tax=Olivibacter jilunii TaxID=985016 RepID=A0ABW6BB57_9SPHI|nr:hypothetical protein [Pseudosphingobacterium sp.]
MMKKLMSALLIAGLFVSCQRNVYFSGFEKSFLAVYKEGDTLIFESNKGERDTSYILRKDIGYTEWNPLTHSGKYRILYGEIEEANGTLPNGELDGRKFVSLIKKNPDSVSLFIAYNNIIMMQRFKNFNIESLDKYKLANGIYRFRILHTKDNVNTEEHLYWHLKYGLIKFVTKEGVIWRRINLNG